MPPFVKTYLNGFYKNPVSQKRTWMGYKEIPICKSVLKRDYINAHL